MVMVVTVIYFITDLSGDFLDIYTLVGFTKNLISCIRVDLCLLLLHPKFVTQQFIIIYATKSVF